tara:strand:- start:114 stop:266 length:153 start_codon:yes stop_codon:yes gene_type:complete
MAQTRDVRKLDARSAKDGYAKQQCSSVNAADAAAAMQQRLRCSSAMHQQL